MPVQHRLDKIGHRPEPPVILPHQRCQKRREQIHRHFHTPAPKTAAQHTHHAFDPLALQPQQRLQRRIRKDVLSRAVLEQSQRVYTILIRHTRRDPLRKVILHLTRQPVFRQPIAALPAGAAKQRLRAHGQRGVPDAVQKHAVKGTSRKITVVFLQQALRQPRLRGAAEIKCLVSVKYPRAQRRAGQQTGLAAQALPQRMLGEHGKPQPQLCAAAVQSFPQLPIQRRVLRPSHDHSLYRYVPQSAKNILRGNATPCRAAGKRLIV